MTAEHFSLLAIAGGVGLFLLGMVVMTDGLRAMAGTALRRMLRNSTRNPLEGVLTGALATAILQSSAATTVATVGFVGAGLITFQQALGIVFGASIGTTFTGWLIALIGFRLNLAEIVMPLILFGALMRLFARGKIANAGLVTAGFSLLFFGLQAMQGGMTGLENSVGPGFLPSGTFGAKLELVGIGIVITLITQSSSAGVAICLAAIAAGKMTLLQAASLVIGMNIGTSFAAGLAAIGGSIATKRTAGAHIIFNTFAALLAFLLLTPLDWLAEWLRVSETVIDEQIALVTFHTGFNILAVVLVIGLTGPFADLVMKIVPDRGPKLTARIDDRLLADPHAAADAVAATISDISNMQFATLARQLEMPSDRSIEGRLETIAAAEEETRRFVDRIRTTRAQPVAHGRHMAAVHGIDHLMRLTHRCRQADRIEEAKADPELRLMARRMRNTLLALSSRSEMENADTEAQKLYEEMRRHHNAMRENAIAAATEGGEETAETLIARLDAMRWFYRTAYHIWRIEYHRAAAQSEAPRTNDVRNSAQVTPGENSS
jgi:phosphate:Na+ symporter